MPPLPTELRSSPPLERMLRIHELLREGRAEVVAKFRSAGSGGYLSAIALAVRGRAVEVRARVADLEAPADVVNALRDAARKKRS